MLQKYIKINNSYKEKLVFNLGAEAGFFSEYNNMLLAMAYCLKNKVRFELYSKTANFGYEKGWQDFFLPFCEENVLNGNTIYNGRQSCPAVRLLDKIKMFFFKKYNRIDYLTFELWEGFHNRFFKNEIFDFPSLGWNGSTKDICRFLHEMIWRYNFETQEKKGDLVHSLALPAEYVGVHIRLGDKFVEYERQELEKYISKVTENSNVNEAFILTDDYSVIHELERLFPAWKFYTLCKEDERGYYHQEFLKKSIKEKRDAHIRLFTSMDILAKASLFVGTYSSNPGMNLGMRMNKEKIKAIDYEEWIIW